MVRLERRQEPGPKILGEPSVLFPKVGGFKQQQSIPSQFSRLDIQDQLHSAASKGSEATRSHQGLQGRVGSLPLPASGGSWWLLAAPGGFWWLLVAPGGSWWLLAFLDFSHVAPVLASMVTLLLLFRLHVVKLPSPSPLQGCT